MADMDEQLTFGDKPQAAPPQAAPNPQGPQGPAQDTSGLTFGDHPGQASSMPQPAAEQPGFLERSGLASMGKLASDEWNHIADMPQHVYDAMKGLHQAMDYVKSGDTKKASMLAVGILSNLVKSPATDPIYKALYDIAYTVPMNETKQAQEAFHNNEISSGILHYLKAVPVAGGIVQAGENTVKDLTGGNASGFAGDVVPFVAPEAASEALEFGSTLRAAKAAEAVEGGEQAVNAIKSSAVRPSIRQKYGVQTTNVAGVDIPVPAESSRVGGALEAVANDPAAARARLQAQHTQPAAVKATNATLEDVARQRIENLRNVTGDNTPFEGDMSSIAKQSRAMEQESQKVYQRFDEASDQDVDQWKQSNDIAKQEHEAEQADKEQSFNEAEQAKQTAAQAKGKPYTPKKFQAEEFEGEEKPETFAEMQSKRQDAIAEISSGDPAVHDVGMRHLKDVEGRMDAFAADHADVVSGDEYEAANSLRRAASKHEFIWKKLNIEGGTGAGGKILPSITPASLRSLPKAFDKAFGGEGAFESYLGKDGVSNYNAIRDVLADPVESTKLLDIAQRFIHSTRATAVGATIGGAAAGPLGTAAGAAVGYGIGRLAENLLFNPEFGQAALKTLRTTGAVVKGLAKGESGEMTVPGTGTNAPVEGTPESAGGAEGVEGVNKDNIYSGAGRALSGQNFFESAPPVEGPNVPTFYSKAEQVIGDKVPNNASGESIKALLKNSGVKDDEMKWAGLDDYLKDKPKVSKADLQQFIRENQIQVKDVTKGTAEAGGLTADEEKELSDLKLKMAPLEDARIRRQNAIRYFGVGSPQYEASLRKYVDVKSSEKYATYAQDVERIDELDKKQEQGLNLNPVKYGQYTVPGEKSNYQEKLLTLPPKNTPEVQAAIKEYDAAAAVRQKELDNYENVAPAVEERFQRAQAAVRNLAQSPSDKYASPHWQGPNVVAHVRYSDRPAVDGKKTLFMEEAQSDWHSAGRHEGYKASPQEIGELNAARDAAAGNKQAFFRQVVDRVNKLRETLTPQQRTDYGITQKPFEYIPNNYHSEALVKNAMNAEEQAEFKGLDDAHVAARNKVDYANKGGVPDAPFKQSWHELVMKRMLRQAAENGYDRLAWTTGDQQAELYDLAKHIGKVKYDPEAGELTAYDPSGKKVISGESVDPDAKSLAPYIGQEAAQKLARQIEDYESNSGPDEDSLWEHYSQQYEVAKADTGEDGEQQYVVKTDYGEDEGPFDSERQAQHWIGQRVRDDVQSEAENYEAEKPELPSLSGLDLHTGGEFHKLLYDQMIPSFLKKYAKKWGAQVGQTEMKGMGDPARNTKVHSIEITPAMKKSVMKEGQPISKAVPPQIDRRKIYQGAEGQLA